MFAHCSEDVVLVLTDHDIWADANMPRSTNVEAELSAASVQRIVNISAQRHILGFPMDPSIDLVVSAPPALVAEERLQEIASQLVQSVDHEATFTISPSDEDGLGYDIEIQYDAAGLNPEERANLSWALHRKMDHMLVEREQPFVQLNVVALSSAP